jgi:hypothetical protein
MCWLVGLGSVSLFGQLGDRVSWLVCKLGDGSFQLVSWDDGLVCWLVSWGDGM